MAEKENKKFSVIKAMSWYAVGNIFVKGMAIFVLPLFSNLMSTYENGIYTTFTSYSTILESIVLFGLSATIRISKYDDEVDYDQYTSTVMMILGLIAGTILLGVNSVLLFNKEFMSFDRTIWNLLIINVLFSSLCIVLSGRLALDGKYKSYFVYLIINTALNLAISLGLVFSIFGSGLMHFAKIYGVLITNIVCFIFMYLVIRSGKPNVLYVKKAIKWGSPLIVHTFLISLFGQLATLSIKNMTGMSSVGIYGMAITLLNIPSVLLGTFENSWNPWFYDKMSEKEYALIKRFNNILYLFFAACIGEFILIIPEVFHILINKNYWGAMYCLMPLSIDVYISFLYYTPLNTQYFHKVTKNVMTATIISFVSELVMLYILINKFNYYGAAYAVLISRIVLLLVHTYFAKKLEKNELYSRNLVVGSIVLLIALDIISSVFANSMMIRLSLFVIIGVYILFLVFKNWKELLKLFNGGK